MYFGWILGSFDRTTLEPKLAGFVSVYHQVIGVLVVRARERHTSAHYSSVLIVLLRANALRQVDSLKFNLFCLIAVILNCATIGLEAARRKLRKRWRTGILPRTNECALTAPCLAVVAHRLQ